MLKPALCKRPPSPGSQTEARILSSLHKRLAWSYTATTGTILTICLLFLLLFFWREAKRQQLDTFEASYLSLLTRLQSDYVLSDQWLAQMEAEQKLLIHIEENGIPLRFQGSWSPPSLREVLLELGLQRSLEEGIRLSLAPISSQVNQSALFLVNGPEGDCYYGKSAVLSTKNSVRGFCLLGQRTPILRQLGPLLLLMCFLEPAALCLLFLISWELVGRSLAPVRESREKQARFIAAASHELRSPLAVIRSSAEALSSIQKSSPKLPPEDGQRSRPGATAEDAQRSRSESTAEDAQKPSPESTAEDAQKPSPESTAEDAQKPSPESSAEDAQKPSPESSAEDAQSSRPESPAEDAHMLCRAIDRECMRMSQLIEDMLLLASADAGSWSLKLQTIDADTLLLEAYETFVPLCRQKKIGFLLDLPEDPLPRIWADPQRLTQILSILLDNALTYTPPGKQLGVQAFPSPTRHKTLTICLWDEGPGIPDPEKERIFDRFYQADPSRHDKQHFGLGLSIARELAEKQGGSLTAHDHPGGGALFKLCIPVRTI